MTSVDELFKKPLAAGQKRKISNPNDNYKAKKLAKSDATDRSERSTQPAVEDAKDEESEYAGPELPPELDGGEDEDGRFFGGGINKDTAQVLDYIDGRENEVGGKEEKVDLAWLRKTALSFEKKISKNAELRAKFDGDPKRFMDSEADLDNEIKALSVLSEHPELYAEFSSLGCSASLVSLLAHENADIAIDAIETIRELVEEDVEADESQWNALVESMLEADLLSLLASNISRLDESSDSDRAGVYHIMGVLESLAAKSDNADVIGKHESIIPWLLSRAIKDERPVSQNKQYAAEILEILLQAGPASREKFLKEGGIDKYLQALSAYRRKDPEKGSEEEELFENLFNSVTRSVDADKGKEDFIDAEGVELCLIMLKEGQMSKARAVKVLDHLLWGTSSPRGAEKVIDAAGIKPLFSTFMKSKDTEQVEHIFGILASLFRLLQPDSSQRIRLLAKFVEKKYEKLTRLLALRKDCKDRLDAVDSEFQREKRSTGLDGDEFEDELLLRRMQGGLAGLQNVDIILAWLIAEDDGAKSEIVRILKEQNETLEDIRATLQGQLEDETAVGTDENSKEMLEVLSSFL